MNWPKISAIARKELHHFFVSPIGYAVLTVFWLIMGTFFFGVVIQGRMPNLGYIFQNLFIILLFLTPLITMRLWSEEEKTGTSELLNTSPLTAWDIVLGKFLGVTAFFLVMMSVTAIYALVLLAFGNPDVGPWFANFLGCILLGMAFFSLGLFTSTLSENQIVSAAVAFGLFLMLWILEMVAESAGGAFGGFLKSLSMYGHSSDFMLGIIDLTHVAYFLSLIFVGLFLSVKVLEGKRS